LLLLQLEHLLESQIADRDRLRSKWRSEGRRRGDGSQLTARLQLATKPIMDLAQEGVIDPEQLEKQALAGLLPEYPH
jgi:hypothetical protein